MPGCDFTRRDFLRWSAVALAAPIALRSEFLSSVAAASTQRDDVSPANLELVTLTEDRAVITWYTGYTGTDDGLGRMRPAPTHAEVHWGTHPGRLNRVAGGSSGDTAYHYVELTGLEPGQTYYYQGRSNGKPVPPTQFTLLSGNAVGTSDFGLGTGGPYSFTAPKPPPGRFLFSIALCNDLHMGETEAGRVGGTQITGVEQVPGRPPYPEVMLESLVHDAGKLGADFLLAAGDITAEAVPVDLSKALQLLKEFGRYRRDYFVARGNHDRAHDGDAYAACRVGQWQGNDCFHDQFFPGDEPTYFTRELRGLRVIGIDTYDKSGRGNDAGALSTDQLAWFRAELAKDRDQPTLVFGHHPLVVENSPFPVTPSSSLDAMQAATILQDYSSNPGLFLHHAGHTHRNKRTVSPVAPGVTHQEIAAGKEYPGGFSLLRLYTGGYALNFYKTRSDFAREWSERSRQQISGAWPQFALGSSVQDRNTVVKRDLSNLRPVRRESRTQENGEGARPLSGEAVDGWRRRCSAAAGELDEKRHADVSFLARISATTPSSISCSRGGAPPWACSFLYAQCPKSATAAHITHRRGAASARRMRRNGFSAPLQSLLFVRMTSSSTAIAWRKMRSTSRFGGRRRRLSTGLLRSVTDPSW